MAIITSTEGASQTLDLAMLNLYPDVFQSEEEKLSPDRVKTTLDYYQNIAYSQFTKNREGFVRNYDLLKGILRPEDFYEADAQIKSFMEIIDTRANELPSYVQQYSILASPINTLVGELAGRPDIAKVKAVDQDSKNEELQFKTEILQQYITQRAKALITSKLAASGNDGDEELVNQLTEEKVREYMTSYTSMAERWGNSILEALKIEFNTKEKSEDAFRDLGITSREFHHVYEDNSKLGFNHEVLNPKNVWYLTLPDKKYIKDAYAAGTIHIMELSEIIDRFDLSKEEIDHLKESAHEQLALFSPRESNLNLPGTGQDTIKYDTYSRALLEERLMVESELKENLDPLSDFMGLSSNVATFGYKYKVVQAYWIDKKKIGKLTYIDEDGEVQTTIVDGDEYETLPNEVSIEFGWINQWWKGYKIGVDVYNAEPLKMFDYCPIIGVIHENKNTTAKSLVDMMKPFQMIYNVCMNQLWKLLEKEKGNVAVVQLRRIPLPKEGSAQDAIDQWVMDAKEAGIIFEDESIENTKVPLSNQSITRSIDLTRTNEIQSRINLAQQMKAECYELIGFNRERQGGSTGASQTATSIQNAVSRSYAQTEPYFIQHEYIMNEVYQAYLDAAIYTEQTKPQSTVSYINSEGEQAFVQINGSEISNRDLKVFVTSRKEDEQKFQELRQLSQAMLQNGADPYDIAVLYSTNSVRQMKDTFKALKDAKQDYLNQQQQMQQQELQLEQQRMQTEFQLQAEEAQRDREYEHIEKELDRASKEKIAIIGALGYGEVQGEDNNGNMVPDAMELASLNMDITTSERDYQAKLQELAMKNKEHTEKLSLEREKLQVDRDNQKNDLQIEKLRLQAAKAKKPKPAAKKKK